LVLFLSPVPNHEPEISCGDFSEFFSSFFFLASSPHSLPILRSRNFAAHVPFALTFGFSLPAPMRLLVPTLSSVLQWPLCRPVALQDVAKHPVRGNVGAAPSDFLRAVSPSSSPGFFFLTFPSRSPPICLCNSFPTCLMPGVEGRLLVNTRRCW